MNTVAVQQISYILIKLKTDNQFKPLYILLLIHLHSLLLQMLYMVVNVRFKIS